MDTITDVGMNCYVVVFATYVEEQIPLIVFLGLLEILGGKKTQ